MNQNEQILKHLKKGRKLTAMQALQNFKCFRLASRIHDLRQSGHNIISTMHYDMISGKRWAEYQIATGKKPK